jgi:acyl-CoA synthetase (AMP-forming)/AMP-acid ligase II
MPPAGRSLLSNLPPERHMTSITHPIRLAASMPAGLPLGNLVGLILDHARRSPQRTAFIDASGGRRVSYGELAERVSDYIAGIRSIGLPANARVLLLLQPDVQVYALALAVLACGRSIVLVDGRRGIRGLLSALRDADADAIVGPPALLRWWPIVPALRRARRFTSLDALLPSRRRTAWGARGRVPRATRVDADTPAIISFSSGNTGCAKAIVRTHGVLLAQHRAIAAAFPVGPDDVNLPGFPVATIHNLCCGTATVLPGADLRSMADADPSALLELIERCGVTSLSGAPAYLTRLVLAIRARGAPVARVRHVVTGGGPVGRVLCADLQRAFPRAEGHVIYGATEAEPIASVTIAELLAAGDEAGFLVGLPVRDTRIQLVSSGGERGLTGEVAVRGAQVASRDGWHRTGDVGRLDTQGRLWLLGRIGAHVVHRGRVLHPYEAEAAALSVEGVRAAALVAHRFSPEGELSVELHADADATGTMEQLRRALARRGLASLPTRRRRTIPMDARHASKVSRGELLQLIAEEGR